MSLDLKAEIALAKQRSEAALAEQVNAVVPAPEELDAHTIAVLRPFVEWCTAVGVRHAPARPTTVAAYILNQASQGIAPHLVLTQTQAIEQLHDRNQLANPVATASARYALEQVVAAGPPPRSWTKGEKALWATLPPEVRTVIQRRDADQERAMRTAQNQAAELRQQADAAKSADNEKEIEMTKPKGTGAYHHNDGDPIEKREKDPGTSVDPKGKDLSKDVFRTGDKTDGFSASIPTKE